jgi:hypothetical protein
LVGKGLSKIKQEINREITSKNVNAILNNTELYQGLIKVFNPKDYLNKSLFEIESSLELMAKQVQVSSKEAHKLEIMLTEN